MSVRVGTNPPIPWNEWADEHEALDALYNELPTAAKAILDSYRSAASKARKVADCIKEQFPE